MKQVYAFSAIIVVLLLTKQMFSSKDSNTWINQRDGMTFVRIPAGEFKVSKQNSKEEDSAECVTIPDDFWCAMTEVTVGQFEKFVKQTGFITCAELDSHRFTWESPGFEQEKNHPVVYVSHEDAQAYAEWAGASIPTEVEWLYACHAGTQSTFFWGDSINDEYLWHRQNTRGTGTRPVGTKQPNPWGVYNMVGNVREYVEVCDLHYRTRGSSWTRCPSYKTRQGFLADDMIAGSVEPRLTECVEPDYPPDPYDDDRGFRLVRRVTN